MMKPPSRFLTLLTVCAACVVYAGSAYAFGKKAAASNNPDDPEAVVWVVRPDGSRSCVKDSGEKIEDVASQLAAAGVATLESKKTGDGKLHPMLCGSATGRQNAYRIHAADQARALDMGFQLATKENAPALFTTR
jgi:hypothetical protein